MTVITASFEMMETHTYVVIMVSGDEFVRKANGMIISRLAPELAWSQNQRRCCFITIAAP